CLADSFRLDAASARPQGHSYYGPKPGLRTPTKWSNGSWFAPLRLKLRVGVPWLILLENVRDPSENRVSRVGLRPPVGPPEVDHEARDPVAACESSSRVVPAAPDRCVVTDCPERRGRL